MNELKVVQDTTTAVAPAIDYKAKALEYLSSMGNTLPKQQQTQFLEMAQAFGLNPFKREIYAVGYGNNWNIITGYEVYLKRAERIGKLDGWKATVAGSGENMSATVTIYRKDWKMPFEHTVLFSEACQKTRDKSTGKEKLNSVWSKMPSFMLRKVAIAQAFRLCFPDEFSGMPYIADEMPNEEQMKNISAEVQFNTTSKAEPVQQEAPENKKYTPEQAKEIGSIVNRTYSDGTPIFTDEEKNSYRAMLKSGHYEAVIDDCKSLLDIRLNEAGTIPAGNTDLNEAAELIF